MMTTFTSRPDTAAALSYLAKRFQIDLQPLLVLDVGTVPDRSSEVKAAHAVVSIARDLLAAQKNLASGAAEQAHMFGRLADAAAGCTTVEFVRADLEYDEPTVLDLTAAVHAAALVARVGALEEGLYNAMQTFLFRSDLKTTC